jgi:diguanylate cyclase (GGDEF)-like protein
MEETLAREISRHQRHGDPLSLLFIDCDDFKQVNDTYGHDAGDVYLKYVAENLAELTRMSDMAFRFAGDEFVVILPNQGRRDAEAIALRIRNHLIENPIFIKNRH